MILSMIKRKLRRIVNKTLHEMAIFVRVSQNIGNGTIYKISPTEKVPLHLRTVPSPLLPPNLSFGGTEVHTVRLIPPGTLLLAPLGQTGQVSEERRL